MNITGYTRKVLTYLYKQHGKNGSVYGNISLNIGLKSAEESQEICKALYSEGLAEWRNDQVLITDFGRKWIERFYEEQDERIREFVYDDYNFALLRFLYEQDIPITLEDFPEILMDEAPKKTTGYSSMNLLHIMEIDFHKYIYSPMNKYELNLSGRKYFEHLAKMKNLPLGTGQTQSQKDVSRIFICYAHADQKWLQKLQLHLKALKNYSSIEFEYWDDTQLRSGDKWETTISNELNGAHIAILLISTAFFASDFIKAKELAPLLKNAENKGTRIMPLIIGHSIFVNTPIAAFQATNDLSNPLEGLSDGDQNKIMVKLCHDIESFLSKVAVNS